MPIYMDRHDVSDKVTAENVAQLHKADLKIQHKFECRGLTYWFDEKRKTAFCLIEAPDANRIVEMHNFAHGEIPHQVIEVDKNIVESFLGRIEDPQTAKDTNLNIINDPAFRIILVTKFEFHSFASFNTSIYNTLLADFKVEIGKVIRIFNGRIVEGSLDYFLVSFTSVTSAVNCATKINHLFSNLLETRKQLNVKLKIGISSGVPVTTKKAMFEETIQHSQRLCELTKWPITTSAEVKALYQSENQNSFIKDKSVQSLSASNEKLFVHLCDYLEKNWQQSQIKIDAIGVNLGQSRSQLYRKMILITGLSPNAFLKKYRLNMALDLLRTSRKSISEIAFETGFISPSYFSKCFTSAYQLTPSKFQSML